MEDSKILLVDDDQHILNLLEFVLKKEQFNQIKTAKSGREASQLCQSWMPHLIILDIMLPDTDGLSLCKELRQWTRVPILFLTAKTTDLDILAGFQFGGDDYITKPFNPLEVVARIRAQLRREQYMFEQPQIESVTFDFGRFRVNEAYGQLWVEGEQIECPAKEFQLLVYMCKHPNRIFSWKQLYRQVWEEMEYYGGHNTVKVHIRRLREKIERDPSHPEYLVTVRGLGYKMVLPK
ncbi:DNA-binding response regulator [Thermoflavimicrobium daqui]|uniref:DNA-binding response regulator n=1 Tax=Thermoflavimicrobium daqui TaxID=2137476 RepID=A0A364K3U3_9BACL|nr:DNA-binding response regulator [Thermoflavimicrobium daqui]